jgi:hypothetical protein
MRAGRRREDGRACRTRQSFVRLARRGGAAFGQRVLCNAESPVLAGRAAGTLAGAIGGADGAETRCRRTPAPECGLRHASYRCEPVIDCRADGLCRKRRVRRAFAAAVSGGALRRRRRPASNSRCRRRAGRAARVTATSATRLKTVAAIPDGAGDERAIGARLRGERHGFVEPVQDGRQLPACCAGSAIRFRLLRPKRSFGSGGAGRAESGGSDRCATTGAEQGAGPRRRGGSRAPGAGSLSVSPAAIDGDGRALQRFGQQRFQLGEILHRQFARIADRARWTTGALGAGIRTWRGCAG